jgi:hypothetical protein
MAAFPRYLGTMAYSSHRSVEAKIRRLTREIADIDHFFYGASAQDDRDIHAGMLERKRDDIVRSAVLQLHTAIEDVLNEILVCRILGANSGTQERKTRSKSGRALCTILFGALSVGFDTKLNLAVALRVLSQKTAERLRELNSLRNKCSHNWLLAGPVRRGKRRAQKKPPLLVYKDANLHKVAILKEFASEYGGIYVDLWLEYPD